MDGTCKCGLECPVLTKDIFNFNSQVPTKEPSVEDILKNKDFKHNLCNHKRKIVAMAAFHHSATLQKAAASSVKHVQSKEKQRKGMNLCSVISDFSMFITGFKRYLKKLGPWIYNIAGNNFRLYDVLNYPNDAL